jgi:hypothetical protein
MKSLSKDQFKEYVVKKAKEYILNENDTKAKGDVLKENEEITPDFVKKFALNLKKTNGMLTFQEPLIESKEVVEEVRTFQVGSYENVSIDLKDTLMETMYNYNRKKSLTHGKESSSTAWERLVDYKKFEEEN